MDETDYKKVLEYSRLTNERKFNEAKKIDLRNLNLSHKLKKKKEIGIILCIILASYLLILMVLGVVFKMNIIKPLLSSIMLSSLICLIFFEVLQKQLEELNTMSDTK